MEWPIELDNIISNYDHLEQWSYHLKLRLHQIMITSSNDLVILNYDYIISNYNHVEQWPYHLKLRFLIWNYDHSSNELVISNYDYIISNYDYLEQWLCHLGLQLHYMNLQLRRAMTFSPQATITSWLIIILSSNNIFILHYEFFIYLMNIDFVGFYLWGRIMTRAYGSQSEFASYLLYMLI